MTTTTIENIEDVLFKYLLGDIQISDLEKWVYKTPQIEEVFGAEAYYEFLTLDYHHPEAKDALWKLITKYTALDRFDAWTIKRHLTELVTNSRDPVEALDDLAAVYLDRRGYGFLYHLADVGMAVVNEIPSVKNRSLVPPEVYTRRRKILTDRLPPIREEASFLLDGLTSGEIQITGVNVSKIAPQFEEKYEDLFERPLNIVFIPPTEYDKAFKEVKKGWCLVGIPSIILMFVFLFLSIVIVGKTVLGGVSVSSWGLSLLGFGGR